MRIAPILESNPEEVHITISTSDLWKLFTVEACPNCDEEQVIWSHGVTACPHCGVPLAPCSVCMDENGGCNYATCPYGCNGTDDDLHKPITMPDVPEEFGETIYRFL